MRKIFALTIALVLTFGASATALAAWSASGSGSASAASGTIKPPTGVIVSATGTTVEVTWTAPPPGASPASYTVRRDGTVVCAGSTSQPCKDSGLAPGTTYGYTVQSLLHSWTSAESSEVEATTAAAVGPSLTFSNACPGVVDKKETWTSAVVSSAPTSGTVTVTIDHDGKRGNVDKTTVTIPSGQTTSDEFTYTRDNHNGNDPSSITATATGYDPTPTCTITRQ